MEGFFHSFVVELVHPRRRPARWNAKRALFSSIDRDYNRRVATPLADTGLEQAERP
jgi:hypothetical protein